MTPTKKSPSSSSSRPPLCFFDAFVLHLAGALIGVEQVERAFLYNNNNDPSNNDVCQQRLYWKSPLLCSRNNDVVSSMLLAAPGQTTTTTTQNNNNDHHPYPNNLNDDSSSSNNSQNQAPRPFIPSDEAPSTSPSTVKKAEEKGQKKEKHNPSNEELPLFWDISMTFSATADDNSSSSSSCQVQFGVFYPQSGYHRTVPWTEEMLLTHVRQMGFLPDDSASSSFRPNDLAKALADGFLQSSSITTTNDNHNNSSLDHGKIVISKTTLPQQQQQQQQPQVALNFSWWYPKLESRGQVTALPVQTIATSLKSDESSLLLECILQVGGFLEEPQHNNLSPAAAAVTHNPYAKKQKQKSTASSSSNNDDKQKTDVNEAVVTTWKARIERQQQQQQQQQQSSSADSGNKSSLSTASPSAILLQSRNAATTGPATKKLKMLPGKGRGKRLRGKIQFLGQQQSAASHKKK